MKKLITALLLFSIIASFCACSKTENKVLKINEVTHSVFYAPFYVAIEKGYFEEEGLQIDLTNGGGSDASMTALLSNSAQIILAGPETGIYTYLGGSEDTPMIFAQLTQRDGSFLVSRINEPNFSWSNLSGKEIIAGRRGGSPAMALEYALNKNGLKDGENVTMNFDVQFNLTVAAFEGGTGDYVTIFEPTASDYQRAGKGFIVASVGEACGPQPETCFLAKKSYIEKNPELLKGFTRALHKGVKFIAENNSDIVAEVLIGQFPSTELVSIKDSVTSYKRIQAWKQDLIMLESDFTSLQDIMENAGELSQRVEYGKLVNTTIAEKTRKEIYG